jgi:hypothetical protein
MTIDDAINELRSAILAVSPDAVVRVMRVSDEEARVRAYTRADDETPIKHATQERTIELLMKEGLDVQVFVYDITTSLPPEE